MEKIYEEMGNAVIKEKDLPEKVGRILIDRNISISSAESCTGGLFAGSLTDIAGISAVFDRSIVTYSNRAKVEELGVPQQVLDSFGAVSRETATAMAMGIRKVSGSMVGVAVTGVAGPDGGSVEKPVGLVYIAAASEKYLICRKFNFQGDRKSNRKNSVLNMYKILEAILNQL